MALRDCLAELDRLVAKGTISEDTARAARSALATVDVEAAASKEIDTSTITDITDEEIRRADQSPVQRREEIRDQLKRRNLGVAAMDPVAILEGIDRRRSQKFPRDYRVVTEFGGDRPGQVVERDGRQYWAPAYGPVAGELIEINPGVPLTEVQEFAAGPPGVAPVPAPVPQSPFDSEAFAEAPFPPTFAPSGPASAAPPATRRQQALAMALASRGQ